MKAEDFVEVSAYLRVLEKRILSSADVDRISESTGASEALRQITQNGGYDFSSIKKTEDYEYVLKDGLKSLYELMYKLVPHREVVDLTAAKYDFHNLKTAVKAKHIGKDMSYLYSNISELDMNAAESLTKGAEVDGLPEHAVSAIRDAEASFAENGDPQEIDIVLDKLMFIRMLELCGVIGNDFITEYVRLSIDFYNIKTLMRVKNMHKGTRFLNNCLAGGGLTDTSFLLANYDKSPDAISSIFYYKYFGDTVGKGIEAFNKSGNFAALEKLFDDYLIEHTKKAKFVAFGPEVPFTYILSKENEIRQIRVLVTCKNNNMRVEALKERLRKNYA